MLTVVISCSSVWTMWAVYWWELLSIVTPADTDTPRGTRAHRPRHFSKVVSLMG